ncbi:DUF190 domain-containing protein [Thermosipho ferrireducens]|uniref:DUF190 domain-containing protein n=1 Tax=Thermosipho ferrireducens TaxID=2571116 RepID=A0ABX7S659_9BACT|nr:DUF190 domain-containing protein [Thermosipho ferrireducens]QTA37311.1 DUF190 domain-containing protein [Thermosipho ferrireducens]
MKLLKIYLGEKDRIHGKTLAEYIVELAYKNGIRGVTVCKGILGYGKKRHIHRSDFFTLSEDLPITVEIVDEDEKVSEFLNIVKSLDFDGLIVTYPVNAFYMEKKER